MEFKIGDIVEGEIIDFTHEGNGVLKIEKFTVFVPGALIGDKVRVKIEELKKNFAVGKVIKFIAYSSDRTTHNFDQNIVGGGIPLLEYNYTKQLEWKKDKVKMDIIKLGAISQVQVNPTLGMDDPFRYRNHTQIPVGTRNGKTVIGFFERGSHNIIDMEGSILQPIIGDKIVQVIRKWIEENNILAYNKKLNKGVLRHIGIRFNKDKKAMVIIVTSTNDLPNKDELVKSLTSQIPDIVSIYHNINNMQSSPTYGRRYKKIYGYEVITDYIGNYKFNISPNSFFQVNRVQAEKLYNKALEYLDVNSTDTVFDLYCGIGTISLYIANKAKKVYGVEIVKEAIEDAKANAKLNGIQNAEFILGKAEEVFPKLMQEGIKANKVVVDPPSKGCEKEVLEAIIELNPERIVYVSCNSSTMARDIKYLVENGYKVQEVQPVDMFPHTPLTEVVTLLMR